MAQKVDSKEEIQEPSNLKRSNDLEKRNPKEEGPKSEKFISERKPNGEDPLKNQVRFYLSAFPLMT